MKIRHYLLDKFILESQCYAGKTSNHFYISLYLLFRIGTKSSLWSILHFLVVIALISMHEIHLVDLVTLVLSGLIGLMQYANLNPNAPK